MNQSKAKLTVFFEEPFWIGLYERESDGKYEVCKITFGAEPKDYEVYQFLLDNWRQLRFRHEHLPVPLLLLILMATALVKQKHILYRQQFS